MQTNCLYGCDLVFPWCVFFGNLCLVHFCGTFLVADFHVRTLFAEDLHHVNLMPFHRRHHWGKSILEMIDIQQQAVMFESPNHKTDMQNMSRILSRLIGVLENESLIEVLLSIRKYMMHKLICKYNIWHVYVGIIISRRFTLAKPTSLFCLFTSACTAGPSTGSSLIQIRFFEVYIYIYRVCSMCIFIYDHPSTN